MSKPIDKKFSEVISLFNSGEFIKAKEIAKKMKMAKKAVFR